MSTETSIGTVYVTGGASGLGAALAAAVEKRGGRPAVLDRQPPESPHPYEQVDLADSAAAEQAVERLVDRVGPPDAVITAAGTDACGGLGTVPAEQWEHVVAVNLFGTVAVIRAALPHLQRRHGRVITVGSSLGLRPAGDATAYCSSKYAIVGFTRALAMELAGTVGVTMLVPAGMRTHFFDGRDEQYRPADDAPLMDPADVAETAMCVLVQPPGTEVRELVMTASEEPSWP
ncbi:SDR family oxidoreductase [Luteipulveratus halotolerans]|uniref:Short-chain dehydrogenase n=1 Tax=Luteipulveratus halotolerans TaxID=1631356 RepID=A0A0L6CLS6_9MICO|nr:SDR family oxidoreductase [Luteipulveratus halotolerans]KNX38689.1 short-chain dehydrogenase [Luteipulveratus halotolerans]